jgi:hypothetical protein
METRLPVRFQSHNLAGIIPQMNREVFDVIHNLPDWQVAPPPLKISKTCLWPDGGGWCLFDADLVRSLCKKIVDETDPDKNADLLSLLHAVIKDDQEEVRLRALFLVKKYGHAFDDLKGAA